jgi:hypothetical protein
MANQWIVIVKKYSKQVKDEKKAGKFNGNIMKEAIKRAKAEWDKVKGKAKAEDKNKDNKEK